MHTGSAQKSKTWAVKIPPNSRFNLVVKYLESYERDFQVMGHIFWHVFFGHSSNQDHSSASSAWQPPPNEQLLDG